LTVKYAFESAFVEPSETRPYTRFDRINGVPGPRADVNTNATGDAGPVKLEAAENPVDVVKPVGAGNVTESATRAAALPAVGT
jgi:hypothetical protein